MNKEILSNKGTKRGVLAVTALGAAEGAALGSLYMIATAGTGPVIGAVVGGATAFGAEKARRAVAKPMENQPAPKQEMSQPDESMAPVNEPEMGVK